jgi:hypothetical protein
MLAASGSKSCRARFQIRAAPTQGVTQGFSPAFDVGA